MSPMAPGALRLRVADSESRELLEFVRQGRMTHRPASDGILPQTRDESNQPKRSTSVLHQYHRLSLKIRIEEEKRWKLRQTASILEASFMCMSAAHAGDPRDGKSGAALPTPLAYFTAPRAVTRGRSGSKS